jgi:hypothetical protein
MRSLIAVASLTLLGMGQVVIGAESTGKPVVIAAVHAKPAAVSADSRATKAKVTLMATPSKEVPEGSLEKFGSVGLPQ